MWKFVVQAIDNDGHGLVGYADLQVTLKDINDNAPIFPSASYGQVNENSDPDTYVMTVTAVDYDDATGPNAQLDYSMSINKELNGKPIFRIDNNGKIFVMVIK